jgi:hypothetical protein
MPKATVRANARTLPKSTNSMPAGLAKLYRPGVLERGIKVLAKAQDDVAVKKEAPAPEAAPQDDYIPALAAKIIAEARYDKAAEKRKAEVEATAKASASKSNLNPRVEHAFFSVEGEIRDVSYMASIACSLISDVGIGAETAGTIALKISLQEFERIQFAVGQTSMLAKKLVTAFEREFEEGVGT